MIDRLTQGVADGSEGTGQIKIWLIDDTFFPRFLSYLLMCRMGIKRESITETALNQSKYTENDASTFYIFCVWKVIQYWRNYEVIKHMDMTNSDILSADEPSHKNFKCFITYAITCFSVLVLWISDFAYSLTSKIIGLLSW